MTGTVRSGVGVAEAEGEVGEEDGGGLTNGMQQP